MRHLSHSRRSTRAASSVLEPPPSSAPAKRAGGSADTTYRRHPRRHAPEEVLSRAGAEQTNAATRCTWVVTAAKGRPARYFTRPDRCSRRWGETTSCFLVKPRCRSMASSVTHLNFCLHPRSVSWCAHLSGRVEGCPAHEWLLVGGHLRRAQQLQRRRRQLGGHRRGGRRRDEAPQRRQQPATDEGSFAG